jgi:hypothetical protein
MNDNQPKSATPKSVDVNLSAAVGFWLFLAVLLAIPTALGIWPWLVGACVAVAAVNYLKRFQKKGAK